MEKINIAEILKDCPLGMELDSTNYDGVVKFEGFNKNNPYPIRIVVAHDGVLTAHSLTKYGQTSISSYNKCVIFPLGKTTWKGFIPPGKFKDGDILFVKSVYNWIIIYKKEGKKEEDLYKYVAIPDQPNHTYMVYDNNPLCYKEDISEIRLATEEEKEKLFKTIKEKGYTWNTETKTLEKLEDMVDKGNISDGYHTFNELYEYRLLYNASMFNELAKQGLYDVHKSKLHSDGTIPFGDKNWFIVQAELPTGQISNHYEMKDWELFNVPEKEKANPYDGHTPQDVAKRLRMFLTQKKHEPKFKIGDKIKQIGSDRHYIIKNIEFDRYILNNNQFVRFTDEHIYELVVEPKFKDGDILFVDCSVDEVEEDEGYQYIFILNKPEFNGKWHSYCHLDGYGYFYSNETYLTDDEYHPRFATEEEKEKLFKAIKENGYKWNAETKTLEKFKPKFKVGDIVQYITDSTDRRKIEEIDTLCNMYHTDSSPIIFEIEDEWKSVLNSENIEQNLPDKVEPKFKVGDRIRSKKDSPINISNILITKVNEYSYKGVIGDTTNPAHISFKHQDLYELAPNKFDIATFVPFESRVLVRDCNLHEWEGEIFIRYTNKSFNNCNFTTPGGRRWKQCIPYEGNEHLLGTTNDCNEFYKTWE